MKRIDDFVKLLVGLIVSLFLKDAHVIRDGLRLVLHSNLALFAEFFPLAFVAFVIRNVHASFRYDAWATIRKFAPAFEARSRGRAWSFTATVLALFVSNFVVEHSLSGHLVKEGTLLYEPGLIRSQIITAFLMTPFLTYFVWDLILWLQTDSVSTKKDRVMQRILRRWLLMDLGGLIWLTFCLIYYILRGPSDDNGLRIAIVGFACLATATTVADYVLNLNFYFKEIKPRLTVEKLIWQADKVTKTADCTEAVVITN